MKRGCGCATIRRTGASNRPRYANAPAHREAPIGARRTRSAANSKGLKAVLRSRAALLFYARIRVCLKNSLNSQKTRSTCGFPILRHILKIRAARKMMRLGAKRRRRIHRRAISTRTGLPGAKYVRSSVKSAMTFGLTCDIIQSMKGLAL